MFAVPLFRWLFAHFSRVENSTKKSGFSFMHLVSVEEFLSQWDQFICRNCPEERLVFCSFIVPFLAFNQSLKADPEVQSSLFWASCRGLEDEEEVMTRIRKTKNCARTVSHSRSTKFSPKNFHFEMKKNTRGRNGENGVLLDSSGCESHFFAS